MIESLTEAQKVRFPDFIQKWTKIGTKAIPVNRVAAKEAINRAYERAGLKAPLRIVWFASSSEMLLYAACLSRRTEHPAFASVWASVGASVGESVRVSVGASVWASVGESVRESVWESVGESVWDLCNLAFYDYFREVCGLKKETEKIAGFIEAFQECHFMVPIKGFCLCYDESGGSDDCVGQLGIVGEKT